MTDISQNGADDDSRPETLTEFVERLRRTPPRPGLESPTLDEAIKAQGVRPINAEEMKALACPGAFYEGFEEDVRRMRRGLEPIGPDPSRKPDPDYKPVPLGEFIERLRRMPARPGLESPTVDEAITAQGTRPINPEEVKAPACRGAVCEGFAEGVRRMRRGLEPIGPRR